MLNIKEIYVSLSELVEKELHLHVLEISPLPASGSARKYFRIKTDKGSLIATYNANVDENKAFIVFSEHFASKGLPVPEILAVNTAHDLYVQTDFGDDSLFKHVQNDLGNGTFSSDLINLYKKTLDNLVGFQIYGHDGLDYCVAFPTPAFDEPSIMEDLNYFKFCFLKVQDDVSFNETRLNDDFKRLTSFIQSAPSDFFMYRDFQSRNVMILCDEPKFIDYQGGRKGPLQYDVVSLLYQVKACIPEEVRNELINYYKVLLSKSLPPEHKAVMCFDYFFPAFVLLRLLQVLGAYGFRGLIQKKLHFVQSIPLAVRELMRFNERWQMPFDLPELQSVIRQFDVVLERYQYVERETLTVNINSFSYKNGGIPLDVTGNGGGFVFDCRALPNPGRLEEFKKLTGEDTPVQDYLNAYDDTHFFLQNVQMLVYQSVDNYLERGFKCLQINFGCTGGQHRSVFFARTVANLLRANYPNVNVELNHIAQNKSYFYEARK
ncbi:MAG: phosphotransferase [Candidatus Limimorpha sp.]